MQEQQPPEDQVNEIVIVDSVDDLYRAILQWHTPKLGELLQMAEVPDGVIEIEVEGVKKMVEGEFRTGFIAGLQFAAVMFGSLPFQVVSDDTPENSPESSGDGPKPT